jgi:hypothetical protein
LVKITDRTAMEHLFSRLGQIETEVYQDEIIYNLQLNHALKIKNQTVQNLNYTWPKKNILAIATSSQASQKIIEVDKKYISSIKNDQRIEQNLFSTQNSFIQIYWHRHYWQYHLSFDNYFLQELYGYYFNQENLIMPEWLSLTIDLNQADLEWQISNLDLINNFVTQKIDLPYELLNLNQTNHNFIKHIFKEPIFFTLNIDWHHEIKNILQQSNFKNYFEHLEKKYNFNLEQDVLSLLKSENLWIVFDNELNKPDKQNLIEHLNKCFDFSTPGECVWIIKYEKDFDRTKFKKIEQILQYILALKFPQENLLTLPDHDQVIELVVNPDNFKFEQQEVNNYQYHFLRNDIYNLEFGYVDTGDKVFYSNNLDLLNQTLYSHEFFNPVLAEKSILDQTQSLFLKLNSIYPQLNGNLIISEFGSDKPFLRGYLD